MVDVVLVDEHDNEMGRAEKLEAHEKGLLHRAISIVLFQQENPELFLMQQRAAGKYHCPLMWANTCCSHPLPGEAPLDAAHRRLKEELGLELPKGALIPAGTFVYRAEVDDLIEHELDHVFLGTLSKEVKVPLNPAEVAEIAWENAGDLPPRNYVPWLDKVLYKSLQVGISADHDKIIQRKTAA